MSNQNTCAGCGRPIPWGKVYCAQCNRCLHVAEHDAVGSR